MFALIPYIFVIYIYSKVHVPLWDKKDVNENFLIVCLCGRERVRERERYCHCLISKDCIFHSACLNIKSSFSWCFVFWKIQFCIYLHKQYLSLSGLDNFVFRISEMWSIYIHFCFHSDFFPKFCVIYHIKFSFFILLA